MSFPGVLKKFILFSFMANIVCLQGDISSGLNVYVRVHSECLTGDVFGSTRCDCGSQLAESLKFIHETGRGIVVYMRGHEGRGIGLGHKMKAYNLQDAGADTVEANLQLGLPVDSRDYKISAEVFKSKSQSYNSCVFFYILQTSLLYYLIHGDSQITDLKLNMVMSTYCSNYFL